MTPLADRVRVRAVAVLASALVVVGVSVAVALHVRAVAALDVALVAAAEAHAVPHPEPDPVEALRAIPVRFLAPGVEHPANAWRGEAAVASEPILRSRDGVRYALVGLSRLGVAEHPEIPGEVVVAWAPEVRVVASVGPFLLVYALAASATALAAAAALRPLLRDALAPLAAAAAEVDRVVGAGTGVRVGSGGPPEIAALLRAVDALLDRLDRAFAAQTRFTAYAAHELRTPVAALRGEAEVALRREREPAAYREALARIAGAARDLGDLVDGLVALTRLDAGEAERHRDREHASALVHAAARREAAALDAAGVTLRVDVHDDPEIRVHVPLVELAVANLLRNVARHAPGSHAVVTLASAGDHVAITVSDDGPGLGDADPERLFERYARGPEASPGLGLGLSLVREIARRHGGHAEIVPSAAGTTVRLTLRA